MDQKSICRQPDKKQKSKIWGFTLIELLVTFSIIAIIAGLGFASFSSYSRRQIVTQASYDVKQAIDLARFDSLSSVKPAVCAGSSLDSYQVNFCSKALCKTSNVDYEIVAACGATSKVVLTKKYPQNVTTADINGNPSCASLIFNTLSGIGTGAPCATCIRGYGNQFTIAVDANGYVSITNGCAVAPTPTPTPSPTPTNAPTATPTAAPTGTPTPTNTPTPTPTNTPTPTPTNTPTPTITPTPTNTPTPTPTPCFGACK